MAIQQLASALDKDKIPEFASVTLSDLTASRLVSTDADKKLASTNLYTWVAGTANEVDIADDGDGTVTIGLVAHPIVDGITIKDSSGNTVLYCDENEFYITAPAGGAPVTGNPIGLLLILTYS